MPVLLSTPVIKFGGRTLQGLNRFGKDEAEVLDACRECKKPQEVYEVLAQARNLARARRLAEVANEFILPLRADNQVPVIVVSAFDVATDKLENLAGAIASTVAPEVGTADDAVKSRAGARMAPREFARLLMSGELRANSALSMMLEMMGAPARSMTGREAGIVTRLGSGIFGPAVDALIQTVHEGYLLELVVQGIIPIVAGFQGYYSDPVSGRDEVSVLGRGGSNLTAVALADALGQEDCTMYSDVDGVYDCDPRKNDNAQRYDEVPAGDLYALPNFPNVIQHEAVAYAAYRGVDIWIRSGFDPAAPGTKIVCRGEWYRVPDEYQHKITGEYVEPESEAPDTAC